jgi:lysozyme|tara:strand:- start:1040 stop:1516 length:477 start_codon:yes stop_codon:yes gene_type:complete
MFFRNNNKMNIELCKAEIKRHEGEVLEIYMDSLGYKTLGVGHLCQPSDPEYNWEVGTPVSQEVVDMYYEQDFKKHYQETIHVYGSYEDFQKLPELIQRVLVNMCFNLGGTRLSKFKNMLKACKEHNWNEMARQMQDSRWYYQVGRRSKELQQAVLSVK